MANWQKNPKNFEPCTRADAAMQRRTVYFTGKACRHGHVAPRYVTTGGCLGCLDKWKAAGAQNAFSHDLVPYMDGPLWRSKRLTPEQLVQLKAYVQTAIDTFCAHVLPPVCKACDGTLHCIVPGSTPPRWEICRACAVDEPSTAS